MSRPFIRLRRRYIKRISGNDEKVITVKDMTFTHDSSNQQLVRLIGRNSKGQRRLITDVDANMDMNEDNVV